MKKALKLFIAYVQILLLGTAASIFVAVQYFCAEGIVAGGNLKLLNGNMFIRAFFLVAPVVIIYSGFCMTLYCIHHPERKIISLITYCVLCCATWGAVYPGFIELSDKFSAHYMPEEKRELLTRGYFRTSDGILYYFPEGVPRESDTAAVINMEGTAPASRYVPVKDVGKIIKKCSAPFHDPLIGETVTDRPSWAYDLYDCLDDISHHAWSGGWIRWLGFVSFGLALCSVYALSFWSNWRLINTLVVMFGEAAVSAFNFLYFFTDAIAPLKAQCASWGGIFRHIDEPGLVVANAAIAFVFILCGVVAVLIRAHASRRG